MAGLEADTSSYPKPGAQPSPLGIASQLGAMQSQALQINQQKLDQAAQGMQYLTRAMSAIGPDGTKDQYKRAGADAVEQGLVPPNMLGVWNKKIDDAPTPRAIWDEFVTTAAQHQEIINHHLGQIRSTDTGQGFRFDQIPGKGGQGTPRAFIPTQVPVTQTVLGPNNEPRLQGNQPRSPALGIDSPLGISNQVPVFGPRGTATSSSAQLQPMPPAAAGVTRLGSPATYDNGRLARVPNDPNNPVLPGTFPNQPTGPVTGLAPGESALMEAGATHLAKDRLREADFQSEIYPLSQALPALETLGTKGTGPGTETINQMKSFILSNVPGVKESDFSGTVKDFDLAQKYLTQFVTANSSTGTNDKLAAAFAGNPSTRISNAAAQDVAKSAIALRRMQNAINREFENQNLPGSQYSKWKAQSIQKTDPRAFGVDMMDRDKLEALKKSFKTQQEYDRFEESLNMAKNMGYINPSRK